MRWKDGLHLLVFILLFLFALAYSAFAETVSWSAPKKIGLNKVTPLIGALPDGKLAIVSIDNGALLLGIYSTNGDLIREIEVENPVEAIQYPALSAYEVTSWEFVPTISIDTNTGKITIAYITYEGQFFKQYAGDGQLLIDKTRISYYHGVGVFVKIAVTSNGEIHTLRKFGINSVGYQRFSSAGQPIGADISIPYRDGDYLKEIDMTPSSDNAVAIGLLVHSTALGTLIFVRTITGDVLGPEQRVQTSLFWCPGYLPRYAQCRIDGLNMAVDRGEIFITAFLAGWQGPPYGSIAWGWRPILIRVDAQQGPVYHGFLSESGSSSRPTSEGIWNPDIIPRTQIVIFNGEKWIFWADRRNVNMGNIFLEKLGRNNEVLIDDQLVQFTDNEDYVAAAVDAAGPYVVYMNGFLRKTHADSTGVVSFFTKASTSSISVAGSPAPGSTVNIDFSNLPNAGKSYLAFASLTPGHTFIGNGIALPVRLDPLFFLSIINPSLLFSNSQGTLDSAGNARINLRIHPELPPGATLYAVVVVYDTTGIKHVSLPARIVVEEEIP